SRTRRGDDHHGEGHAKGEQHPDRPVSVPTTTGRWSRQVSRRLQSQEDESGEAVTEAVLLVPVLLLLVTLVVQFGLWYHAEHVVQAAAEEGVRAARAYGAVPDEGRIRAEQFVAAAGGQSVRSPLVAAERSPESVTVRVSGEA